MSSGKSFYLILILLAAKSTAYPAKNDHKIVFIEEEDERFNDLINPVQILAQKVDKINFKKFFNVSSVGSASRFDESQVDDSADDLKSVFGSVLSENDKKEILESSNQTEEFLVDENFSPGLGNYGEFFQGDMMLGKDQGQFLFPASSTSNKTNLPSRTGIIDQRYRWKMNDGLVLIPYKFWFNARYSKKQKTMIRLAMDDIEAHTCIRFVPRSREVDFVLIYSGDDCSSFLGRAGGEQLISLRKDGCFSRGVIIHELIHTLGYDHMQNHPNRDEFVKILWNNIKPENQFNFEKLDPEIFSNFGTPYDYYSVMHYAPTAFSKNGRRTIVPVYEQYRNIIGQREGLSRGDVERINLMYECESDFYK